MAEARLDISWGSILKVFLAIFVFYLIYLAKTIVLWFFFGLAISILLEPGINFFRKIKIPKIISVLLVYFSIFGILGLLIFLSAPIFTNELKQFSQYLPEYFAQINPLLQQLGINASADFSDFMSVLVTNLTEGSRSVLHGLMVFFGGLSATAIILTIAFFLSLEDRGPERFLSLLVPRHYEDQMVALFERVQNKVAGWFATRIIACLFVGAASLVVFYIFDIKYAFLLALISAVMNFIPYLGPWITNLLLIVIVAVSTGSWMMVLYILIAVTVIQEIENKLLSPLLMKKIIDIPPVLVLVSLLIGTEIFGFLGAIFAVPVFGILYEFTKEFLERRKEGVIHE